MSLRNSSALSIGEELSAEFLSSIVDHIAHPIFVKDREYRFVLLNRAMESMVGIPRGDMLGRTDYDFFPKEQADWFRAKDSEMFSGGETVEVSEEPLTDAHGQRHTLATTKVPLRGADGTISHLVGIIHDITPLKRAEDALKEVTGALELRVQERTAALLDTQAELVRRERLAVVGLFAGSLAHQIRNPLGSIKNAAYLVQLANPTQDEDIRRALAIIQDEVGRANQIITDLVDYARVTAAQRRVVPVELLMEIAIHGLDLPDNVTVVTDCPELPQVCVDPAQLQRALQKLVRNALQAMTRGGTLTLSTGRSLDRVWISVADTGAGIAADQLGRLFEPFYTTKSRGTGLGLMTVRRIVRDHGGEIGVESEPGRGTTFRIQLPDQKRLVLALPPGDAASSPASGTRDPAEVS